MKSVELERTFLAKFIPKNLKDGREMLDVYLPRSAEHPKLRARKIGDIFEITKKNPVKEGDASEQIEQTIPLTKEEFDELSTLEGKRVRKVRYSFDYNGVRCEVDVHQGGMKGLVVIDFEFKTKKEKDEFKAPDFCLVEVTQEKFLAGGLLCGKSYEDIKEKLEKLGYRSL
jgi:CYTH domain-containing protein